MLERAREIADSVFFPAAMEVDRSDWVPVTHLDLLAAERFYGLAAREYVDFAQLTAVVSALAGGCLATTFVWLQHLAPVRAVKSTDNEALRAQWLPELVAGRRRAGIAIAGIRNQKNPLRVRRAGSDFVLDGIVPWVTGWGMIDTIYVAALDSDDVIHFLLVDAVAGPTLTADVQQLVAVQASRTANLTFDGHGVPGDRQVSTEPYAEWRAEDSQSSALNGFLALGLADRCVRLLADGPGTAQSEAYAAASLRIRDALLSGDQVPSARAEASDLAWRTAGAVNVVTGARAVRLDQHAQRLAREATFLLVFGSRPAVRDELLNLL